MNTTGRSSPALIRGWPLWSLIVALVAAGLLGYWLGNRPTESVLPLTNTIRGQSRFEDVEPKTDTRIVIPVVFAGSKWNPSLLISLGSTPIAKVDGGDDKSQLILDFDDTTAPLPSHVYFQLWDDATTGMRGIAGVNVAELRGVTEIRCDPTEGIRFIPQINSLRWMNFGEAGIARIGRYLYGDLPPGEWHRIDIKWSSITKDSRYLLVIDQMSSRQMQTIDLSRQDNDAALELMFSGTDKEAQSHYLFVVGTEYEPKPRFAFRVKGSDLLNLDYMQIHDIDNKSPAEAITFTPTIPVDFWPLDGGSQ